MQGCFLVAQTGFFEFCFFKLCAWDYTRLSEREEPQDKLVETWFLENTSERNNKTEAERERSRWSLEKTLGTPLNKVTTPASLSVSLKHTHTHTHTQNNSVQTLARKSSSTKLSKCSDNNTHKSQCHTHTHTHTFGQISTQRTWIWINAGWLTKRHTLSVIMGCRVAMATHPVMR